MERRYLYIQGGKKWHLLTNLSLTSIILLMLFVQNRVLILYIVFFLQFVIFICGVDPRSVHVRYSHQKAKRARLGSINPLNAELNPIRHLLALAGADHFVHVGSLRVKIEQCSFQYRREIFRRVLSHRMFLGSSLEPLF